MGQIVKGFLPNFSQVINYTPSHNSPIFARSTCSRCISVESVSFNFGLILCLQYFVSPACSPTHSMVHWFIDTYIGCHEKMFELGFSLSTLPFPKFLNNYFVYYFTVSSFIKAPCAIGVFFWNTLSHKPLHSISKHFLSYKAYYKTLKSLFLFLCSKSPSFLPRHNSE